MGINNELGNALPGRRARLKAFLSLKLERTILRSALGAAVVALGVTGVVAVGQPAADPVQLGNGKAGVDTTLSPIADADMTVASYEPIAIVDMPDILPDAAAIATEDAVAAAEDALDAVAEELGIGGASYYGDRFAGRKTANGEIFDPMQMTAAHRTLPMGSKVRVTHEKTGETVIVRINDRGPFHGKRVIDLSKAAAKRLGMIRTGTARVKLELLKS
ncbi:MAG: septal ring lytic transglycosylase RlpA family protein [Pacificimonas sp.]